MEVEVAEAVVRVAAQFSMGAAILLLSLCALGGLAGLALRGAGNGAEPRQSR